MQYLIGVDLGTQGTKASLCDTLGNIIIDAFEASNLITPEAGTVEQNPEEMLSSVISVIKQVVEGGGVAPKDIAAIGLDGQMAGTMGIDRSGHALTPYDSWLDTRCGKHRDKILRLGETEIIHLTGAPVTYAHGPKIIWWQQEHPAIFNKIRSFIQPAAYCIMRMCDLSGEQAFIDHTYLHFTGFADTANKCWADSLLNELNVPKEKMPRIVSPWEVVGKITAKTATQTGLLEGTPMVAGCGDTAASSLGAGIVRPGLLFDVAGTASVFACAVDKYNPDTKNKTIMFAPSVIDGLYTPMAYINGGGMCLRWLRDDVLSKALSYDQLNELAQSVLPGSENLFFLPHFSGRVCPNDTLVRGSYVNLTWNHTSAHLYRAILESIAYEYGVYGDIIKELVGAKFERIISVGGGSKSSLFNQIKANVLGARLSTINRVDTAALACCAIAGYGVGIYDSISDTVESSIKLNETFEPDQKMTEFYAPRKSIYISLFQALQGVFSQIANLKS